MGEIYDKWSVCDWKVRCWEQETTQVLPFGGEWMVESSCGVLFCSNWELLLLGTRFRVEKRKDGERNKSQFFVTYLGGNLQLSPLVDSWYCPPNCCPTTRLTLHYC